jgi:Protein of unknown function (DUF3040)
MLDRYERDILREIERHVSAADPGFAARLRDQRRLTRLRIGTRVRRAMIIMLVVLTVGLIVLGLPGSAVVVAMVAGCVWWLGRCPVTVVR